VAGAVALGDGDGGRRGRTARVLAGVGVVPVRALSRLASPRLTASLGIGRFADALRIGRVVDRRASADLARQIARVASTRAGRVAADPLRAMARRTLVVGRAVAPLGRRPARVVVARVRRHALGVVRAGGGALRPAAHVGRAGPRVARHTLVRAVALGRLGVSVVLAAFRAALGPGRVLLASPASVAETVGVAGLGAVVVTRLAWVRFAGRDVGAGPRLVGRVALATSALARGGAADAVHAEARVAFGRVRAFDARPLLAAEPDRHVADRRLLAGVPCLAVTVRLARDAARAVRA